MAKKSPSTDALIAKLTDTIVELNARIADLGSLLKATEERATAREAELLAQLDALKRHVHGKKTEKMPRPKDAIRKADGTKSDPDKSGERRRANAAARAELPTEIQTYAVLERDRTCPHCGDDAKLASLGDGRRTTEYDL